MSHAQDTDQPAIEHNASAVEKTDGEEYHTLRGCLTLTALVLAFALISFVFLIIFGTPAS